MLRDSPGGQQDAIVQEHLRSTGGGRAAGSSHLRLRPAPLAGRAGSALLQVQLCGAHVARDPSCGLRCHDGRRLDRSQPPQAHGAEGSSTAAQVWMSAGGELD
eukprot:scaffold1130_cov195-Pinguiococcus_pyrenoidosus.AAC.22